VKGAGRVITHFLHKAPSNTPSIERGLHHLKGIIMAIYQVPLVNGVYSSDTVGRIGGHNKSFTHQVSVDANSSVPTGVITIEARSKGSGMFEAIDGGEINLSSPETILFQFNVDEYRFTVSGASGTGVIIVSDSQVRG